MIPGGSSNEVTYLSGSDLILTPPTGAFGAVPHMWTMIHSSSSTGSIQLNGSSDKYLVSGTLDTATGSLFGDDPQFIIGDKVGAGFTGDYVIGEILILDGVPSEEDQQRIEGYLAWKWDLTSSLPNDHPYKDTQPLNNDGALSFTFTGSNVAPQVSSVTGTFSVNREGGFNELTAAIDVTGTAIAGSDYTDIFPLNF